VNAVLGDFLPPKAKNQYVDSGLTPGQIVCLPIDFGDCVNEKLALLLAYDDGNVLLFLVNSQIHPKLAEHADTARCQVRLECADCDFLDHDSYLNCSEVRLLRAEEVRAQVLAETWRLKGRITEAARRQVTNVVLSSRLVSGNHTKLIHRSLKGDRARD